MEAFSSLTPSVHAVLPSRYDEGSIAGTLPASFTAVKGPLPPTMTRVIAFFNQKGGTAKTTSTLNVAAALAERGRRVLTLDPHPHASLAMATGADAAPRGGPVYALRLAGATRL